MVRRCGAAHERPRWAGNAMRKGSAWRIALTLCLWVCSCCHKETGPDTKGLAGEVIYTCEHANLRVMTMHLRQGVSTQQAVLVLMQELGTNPSNTSASELPPQQERTFPVTFPLRDKDDFALWLAYLTHTPFSISEVLPYDIRDASIRTLLERVSSVM